MGACLCVGECFGQVSANTGTWRKGRVFAKVKGKGRVVCHIADLGGSKESLERINLHRTVVLWHDPDQEQPQCHLGTCQKGKPRFHLRPTESGTPEGANNPCFHRPSRWRIKFDCQG